MQKFEKQNMLTVNINTSYSILMIVLLVSYFGNSNLGIQLSTGTININI